MDAVLKIPEPELRGLSKRQLEEKHRAEEFAALQRRRFPDRGSPTRGARYKARRVALGLPVWSTALVDSRWDARVLMQAEDGERRAPPWGWEEAERRLVVPLEEFVLARADDGATLMNIAWDQHRLAGIFTDTELREAYDQAHAKLAALDAAFS